MKPIVVNERPKDHDPEDCRVPGCERCKLDVPFKLPSQIVKAHKNGDLVIFAGAGVSTESEGIFPHDFYEEIRREVKIPGEKKVSFPDLMSLYCSAPRSRKDLLLLIKKRIDEVKAYPELYNFAAEFHREIATVPHLNEIFTTNWDDFFERECDATPVVTSQDFAVVQDTPGRKVFKLHGSIYNYGSIVATKKDYEKCYRRLSTSIIGANLKILLMSKTLVFVGFSFDDEDFLRLYRLLKKEVGGMLPQCYVVTLDKKAKRKLEELDIEAIPILTGATYFVKNLKKRLVQEGTMLPDSQFLGIPEMLKVLFSESEKIQKLSLKEHPDLLYTVAYENGFMHALNRIAMTRNSGEYGCGPHIFAMIKSFDPSIKTALRKKHYVQAALLTGFQAGLVFYLSSPEDRKKVPLYYMHGCKEEIMNVEQCIKLEKKAASSNKLAHDQAKKEVRGIPKGIFIHYPPF